MYLNKPKLSVCLLLDHNGIKLTLGICMKTAIDLNIPRIATQVKPMTTEPALQSLN
jgi:hypothetical protein